MQPTVDLARLFQFGNTPSPAGNGLVPPGGGLPPVPPTAGPGSFMSPYRPPGAMVPRGTNSIIPPGGGQLSELPLQAGEKVVYGSRVPPTALPKPNVMGGAAATALPLASKVAGAAGLALYPPPAGEGSDKPQASGAPGFLTGPPTPIAKPVGGLPQVGPGVDQGGIIQSLMNWAQNRRGAIANDPNTPFKQFQNWLGGTGAQAQPAAASPGGTPLPAGWAPGMPTQTPPVLPMSPIGAGDTSQPTPGVPDGNWASGQINGVPVRYDMGADGQISKTEAGLPAKMGPDAGRGGLSIIGDQTADTLRKENAHARGMEALRNGGNYDQAYANYMNGGQQQGPQGFDLNRLFAAAMDNGPGSASETFAQRGERKANKAIAMKLLGDFMGEQGQNWRAQLGEEGQNQRTQQTLQEHLLSTLMGQKPTNKEFKSFSTKTPDGMGGYLQQDIPGIFDPATGQWQQLPGTQAQQPSMGGHPALTQPYEANQAYWDRFAKENGFKDGRTVYQEYMKTRQ